MGARKTRGTPGLGSPSRGVLRGGEAARGWHVRYRWSRTVWASARRLIGVTLLAWLLSAGGSHGQGITPTTEWINLYSQSSTWEDQPLPAGTVVAVFRPGGMKCGEVVVQVDGWYGLLPCYGEPVPTGEVAPLSMASADAINGPGPLTFTVNGHPANAVPVSLNGTPVPPSTRVTWTANGDLWQVDLRGQAGSYPVGGRSISTTALEMVARRRASHVLLALAIVGGAAALGRRAVLRLKNGRPG